MQSHSWVGTSSSYFLIRRRTCWVCWLIECRVVSNNNQIQYRLVLLHSPRTFQRERRERERAVTLYPSTIMFYASPSLSSPLSFPLCDSFMAHLAALIWVPFLTLFSWAFSKFNTSRIHMHNVMRDLLYEYEYYRAGLSLSRLGLASIPAPQLVSHRSPHHFRRD